MGTKLKDFATMDYLNNQRPSPQPKHKLGRYEKFRIFPNNNKRAVTTSLIAGISIGLLLCVYLFK